MKRTKLRIGCLLLVLVLLLGVLPVTALADGGDGGTASPASCEVIGKLFCNGDPVYYQNQDFYTKTLTGALNNAVNFNEMEDWAKTTIASVFEGMVVTDVSITKDGGADPDETFTSDVAYVNVFATAKFPVTFYDDKTIFVQQYVSPNETASEPQTYPVHPNMTFLYWAEEDGTPFNYTTKINKAVSLYAKYQENEPETPVYSTVTFDAMNGTDPNTVQVKNGEKVVQPSDPSRPGYEFAGWYTDYEELFTRPAPEKGDNPYTGAAPQIRPAVPAARL